MNTINLKYQVSLFGNYDEISLNQETIRTFFDMFSDQGFIPNTQNEINIEFNEFNKDFRKNTVPKLRLSSSDNSWNISFGSERIDFILTNISIDDFDMPEFDRYIDNCKDFINRISEKYSKKHRRIGVVQNILLSEQDDAIPQKICRNISLFENKPLLDWVYRASVRENVENESLNVISEMKKVKIENAQQSNGDGILIIFDVNTIDENRHYRFGKNNVNNCIDVILGKHKELNCQTFNLINANE
jgi:hypothetical protein